MLRHRKPKSRLREKKYSLLLVLATSVRDSRGRFKRVDLDIAARAPHRVGRLLADFSESGNNSRIASRTSPCRNGRCPPPGEPAIVRANYCGV